MNMTDKEYEEYEEYIRFYLDTKIINKPNGTETSVSQPFAELTEYIKNYSKEPGYLFSTPLFVTWVLTSACNFRCNHCLYNDTNYSIQNDLSPEQTMSLADELINDFSIVRVSLTGGEIFARPDIMDIIRKFKENNIAVRLLTNGSLLNDKIIDELSELLEPSTDAIRISLDGATDETFRKVRNTDSFNKIIHNIKRIVNKNIPVGTACALNTINYNEAFDIYNLSKDLGVDFVHYNNMMILNSSHAELKISDMDFFKFYYEIKHKNLPQTPSITFKGIEHDELINIPEVKDVIKKYYSDLIKTKPTPPNTRICHFNTAMDITADGTVYPCGEARLLEVAPLGNYKTNSLMEIWENKINNPMLTPCAAKSVLCLKCKYANFCHGGCVAHGFNCNSCKVITE